ncbi:UNVERIFIED_CONTAM: hypothetical protein FKN15_004946 [Acipenser sinensis]
MKNPKLSPLKTKPLPEELPQNKQSSEPAKKPIDSIPIAEKEEQVIAVPADIGRVADVKPLAQQSSFKKMNAGSFQFSISSTWDHPRMGSFTGAEQTEIKTDDSFQGSASSRPKPNPVVRMEKEETPPKVAKESCEITSKKPEDSVIAAVGKDNQGEDNEEKSPFGIKLRSTSLSLCPCVRVCVCMPGALAYPIAACPAAIESFRIHTEKGTPTKSMSEVTKETAAVAKPAWINMARLKQRGYQEQHNSTNKEEKYLIPEVKTDKVKQGEAKQETLRPQSEVCVDRVPSPTQRRAALDHRQDVKMEWKQPQPTQSTALPTPEQELPRAPEAGVGSADNAEPMQATPAAGPEVGKEPPQEQELPRAPEAGVGSADNAEPMQETPAEGPEGGKEPPLPEQELPRAPEAGVGSADNAEPMQAAPDERPEGEEEPPQKQEPPRDPEASVGSADDAEPMQAAPAEGSEGGDEAPYPEQELPQASLSCGHGGSGPRAAAEGEEITPPEADAGSAEPALTLVSGARKGGEEPERAEGGALEADPLPEVQRGQETGPQGPVPVTEGAREEPLKQPPPPRASLSGGGEGSGPRAAVGGETEAFPVTDAEAGEGPERVYPLSLGEGGEGPERVDPLPSRAEDGPETVPRTSKEGPRAGTRPSGSAAYAEPPSAPPKSRVQTVPAAERPSAPPKSRVQTVPARVPPPISPAASPGGGTLGESVKIKIRRNALTHQRECVVLLHREGGGGERTALL